MKDELKGQRLGKYEILDELGRGGFATVYRAVDTTLERKVALKVLDPLLMRDELWVVGFQREAKTIAGLRHPHIVTIYEIGEAEGRLFIAMELLTGGSLAGRIREQGHLTWDDTMRIVSQVADALDYAHQRNVIHRDIKPSNILLDEHGDAVLTDFGFAKIVGESSLGASLGDGIVGTPAYIAPEIWHETEARPQTDVYALACVVYEMLTGEVLFAGQTPPAVMTKHCLDGPQFVAEWPQGVPMGIEQVLRKALAREPEDRYPSASAFVAELQALAVREAGAKDTEVRAQDEARMRHAVSEAEQRARREEEARAPEKPQHPKPPDGQRKFSRALAAIAVLVLAGALAAIVWGAGGRGEPRATLSPMPATEVKATEVPPTPTTEPTGDAALMATPSNTLAATPVPGATRALTAEPTLVVHDAVVNHTRLNLRTGPGEEYPVMASYPQGTSLKVVGKAAVDATWLKVETPDGRTGWMWTEYLQVNVNLAVIPLAMVPPTPRPVRLSLAGRIAFAYSVSASSHTDIYVANADGTGITRLTTDASGHHSPTWSCDGTRIAFVCNGQVPLSDNICTIDAQGGNMRQLTDSGRDDQPSWSPSCDKIAFASARDGDWKVYVMNSDGSGLQCLTPIGAYEYAPAWSPDGKRIAVVSNYGGPNGQDDIVVMNVDGSDRRNITNSQLYSERYPRWSPDGQRIAFALDGVSGPKPATPVATGLYVMDADGTDARLIAAASWVSAPVWSPDGESILYVAAKWRDGVWDKHCYIVSPDGSNSRVVEFDFLLGELHWPLSWTR